MHWAHFSFLALSKAKAKTRVAAFLEAGFPAVVADGEGGETIIVVAVVAVVEGVVAVVVAAAAEEATDIKGRLTCTDMQSGKATDDKLLNLGPPQCKKCGSTEGRIFVGSNLQCPKCHAVVELRGATSPAEMEPEEGFDWARFGFGLWLIIVIVIEVAYLTIWSR